MAASLLEGRHMITLVVADDHAAFRQALVELLNRERDMEVIGSAADGYDAIQLVAALTPDVIVMDLMMPGIDGIEATRQIRRIHPGGRTVAVSVESDSRLIKLAIGAGAVGFVRKSDVARMLPAAVRSATAATVHASNDNSSTSGTHCR